MENRIKILITADDGDWGSEVSAKSSSLGVTITYVKKNGQLLLEQIRELKPDVICTDFFMPVYDAITIINTVKKEELKTPLFVIMSTYMSPILEREIIAAGASYIAITPFNKISLIEKMVTMVNKNEHSSPSHNSLSNLKVQVTEILHQIGVPAHIKGYYYLRDSIIMSIENPDIINAVTKQLYPSVAAEHNTTSSRVERAIRHAIEVAWDRGDIEILNSYFGYTIHNTRGKPTNSEFIAMISDKLALERISNNI